MSTTTSSFNNDPALGFNFDNFLRNETMIKPENIQTPDSAQARTGTTICGCVYKDGVVLCADSRATGGMTVMDKNIMKLHELSPNMITAFAGTAADCFWILQKLKAELKVMRLNTGRQSLVSTCYTRLSNDLFPYGGYLGANLICGGVDFRGNQLVQVDSHGMIINMPYGTMGSGSLHAGAVLETQYKEGMTKDEALDLCTRAITAGIMHDMGSGSTVNAMVVTKDGTETIMDRSIVGKRTQEKLEWNFPENNVEILQTIRYKCEKKEAEVEEVKNENAMDIEA